jgi:hypothetical protein
MKQLFTVVRRRTGNYNSFTNCTFICNESNNSGCQKKNKKKSKTKKTFLQKLLKFKTKLISVFLIIKYIFFPDSD